MKWVAVVDTLYTFLKSFEVCVSIPSYPFVFQVKDSQVSHLLMGQVFEYL